MSTNHWKMGVTAAAAVLLMAGAASAQSGVSFKDPANDDNGPGNYTYPTDQVYKRGSFDMTGFEVDVKGKKADFDVTFNTTLEDPWKMGGGFSVQMVFIFIDNAEGGNKQGPPGTNITFAEGNEWDKLIILSPQPQGTVRTEVDSKMAALKSAVIIPSRVKAAGRTISASVDLDQLGAGDPSTWGYQVVVQSNEGFPDSTDLLTRKVNEYEGQHRFGGGTDTDCDPHAIDILASDAEGQKMMLKYECNPDGTTKQPAVLKMVRKS